MIDITLLRENPQKIKEAAKHKGIDLDVDHILELDERRRELVQVVQVLREDRNKLSQEIKGKPAPEQLAQGKELGEKLEKEEAALASVKEEFDTWLLKIPNPAKDDVKVGKDETENDVISTYKESRKFNFTPKDHLELGESLDLIDMTRAAKVSGARFVYLKNDAVLLEFALIQFGLETLIKEGFTPVVTPDLIKRSTMQGLGYMENGGEEDMFHLQKDDLMLVGTAEHALVPMHMDETFSAKDLPRRYVGFSNAYRREAGSYGKDSRGIIRVHQFDKLEMVSFVQRGKDDEEHEYLLGLEEKLFKGLEIPYQVVKMCTGDLGFPAARKYDIEAWMPGQNKYREVTSVSTVTDFQSRRLKIKYLPAGRQVRDNQKTEFVSILNGTAFAIGRTIIAILENYQQEDGSVLIPDVLQKYLGKTHIKPRT